MCSVTLLEIWAAKVPLLVPSVSVLVTVVLGLDSGTNVKSIAPTITMTAMARNNMVQSAFHLPSLLLDVGEEAVPGYCWEGEVCCNICTTVGKMKIHRPSGFYYFWGQGFRAHEVSFNLT